MNPPLSHPDTRSIFWPLILVAAGALWLLNNQGYISTSNVWAVLQYWPVLLIAIGVDVLVRWRWPLVANLFDLAVVSLAVGAILFAPRLGLATAGTGWLGWAPFFMGGAPGSGHVVTETRAVKDITAVEFASFGDLTIQQGEQEGLTIEAEDNVLRDIQTAVRGGTLRIGYANGNGLTSVRPTRPIRFTLTVVKLDEIDLAGAGNISANSLNADRLQASLSGAGNLSINDVTARSVTYNLSGAGSLNASGTAGHLDVDISGFGSYKGGSLECETAQVNLSGTGSAVVWVTGQLNANVSGLGSVDYYGQPTVTKEVSGLGTVRPIGNK